MHRLDDVAWSDWQSARDAGLIAHLIDRGLLIRIWEAEDAVAGEHLLESEGFAPITYPSEWSFSMLRDAALFTIDVTRAALERGHELKDASAFTVVFDRATPRFVDVGSLTEGFSGHLRGYAQFCGHFLAPLMLQAFKAVPFQPWLRGSLDGIPVTDLSSILGFRGWFRRGAEAADVIERRTAGYGTSDRRQVPAAAQLPVEVVRRNVESMRELVTRLKPRGQTVWQDYGDTTPYDDQGRTAKAELVREFAARAGGGELAWDIGANDETFSALLLDAYDRVAAMDVDAGAVGRLYPRCREQDLPLSPAVVDFADPRPGVDGRVPSGWRGLTASNLI